MGFSGCAGPVLVVFSGLTALAIIPFGNVQDGFGLYGIDVPIGVLFFFAFSSFAFYGLLLGGWASGSKYSFLGSMRSAAQLISYEISMGLALLGAIMMTGSLSLTAVVEAQDQIWFVIPQFVGFLIFMIAGFAEANRSPFDLPEADAELVAGYQTEYGGMRYGAYAMAEYIEMFVDLGDRRDVLPRRLARPRTRLARPDLGAREDPRPDLRLHVGPGDAAAAALRPADVARLEGPAAARDAERAGDRGAGDGDMSDERRQPASTPTSPTSTSSRSSAGPSPGGAKGAYRAFGETLRGLKTTMARIVEGPVTIEYPEEKTPVYPRFRGRHKLHRFEDTRAREVRRLLALRRRLPGRLHPRRRGRERPDRPGLGRRALRGRLRDQPRPLHLLRLLRGRLPVRRDHDGPRVRDGRLQPRRT